MYHHGNVEHTRNYDWDGVGPLIEKMNVTVMYVFQGHNDIDRM